MEPSTANGIQLGPPQRSGTSQDSTGKQVLSPSIPAPEPRTVRYAPAHHPGTSQTLLPAPQVIALFGDALASAKEATRRSGAVGDSVSGDIKAGVTIELSKRGIQRVPEEAIDLIKNDIERLALNFNQIITLPPKFAECISLRYLNLRGNLLQEFPQAICRLKSLEILDLRSNKLRQIPTEIRHLPCLKILSIQSNRIEKLPLCLGDMPALHSLKFADNPISFPPPEALTLDPSERAPDPGNQLETDALITSRLKEYLRNFQMLERSGTESGDSSNGSPQPSELPRPLKRAASGRFPIKVSTSSSAGSDFMSDNKSPALPRLPPSAAGAHYRGLSQHNAALRRGAPAVPSALLSNERNRSNSESILQATRHKRMGMVTRKTSDLGTVDEAKSNRLSHFRGFSHSSAIQNRTSQQPATHRAGSSTDSGAVGLNRAGIEVQRLSSLPEQKPRNETNNEISQGLRGLLYAFGQLQPHISNLTMTMNEGSDAPSQLQRAYLAASAHLESFEASLNKFNMASSDEGQREFLASQDTLLREGFSAASSFYHVINLIRELGPQIIAKSNPRLVRTLLLNIYACAIEIRDAMQTLGQESSLESASSEEDPILHNRVAVEQSRPGTSAGDAAKTAGPTNENIAMTTTGTAKYQGPGRHHSDSTVVDFPITQPKLADMAQVETDLESQQFERVYSKLAKATKISLEALPDAELWFTKVIEHCRKIPTRPEILDLWNQLQERCAIAISIAQSLDASLRKHDCKDMVFRNGRDFWQLCSTFVKAFVDMAMVVKDAKNLDLIPSSLLQALRPVQRSIKAVGQAIDNSPWKSSGGPQTYPLHHHKQPPITHAMIQAGLAQNAAAVHIPAPTPSTANHSANTSSSSTATAVATIPATPLSAALGPAAQATVPSHSSLNRSNTTLSGNLWERADTLLQQQNRIPVVPHNEHLNGPQTSRYQIRPQGSIH